MQHRLELFRRVMAICLSVCIVGAASLVFGQFDDFNGFGDSPPRPPSELTLDELMFALESDLDQATFPGDEREQRVNSIEETLAELETHGLDAAPALTLLLRCLDREQAKIRGGALNVLGHLGPDAESAFPQISSLLERAARGSAPSRIKTIEQELIDLIEVLGPDAAPLLPTIESILEQKNKVSSSSYSSPKRPFGRDLFSDALRESFGGLDYDPALIVQFYIETLSHPDLNVRLEAINSLGRMRTGAQAAVPALEKLLSESSDVFFRNFVAWALVDISEGGRVSDETQDLILAHFQENPLFRYRHGPTLLGSLRPVRASSVEMLLDFAGSSESYLAFSAIGQLGDMGSEAAVVYPDCVPRLQELLESDMPYGVSLPINWSPSHWNVIHALGNMGPAAESALPCLLRIIQKRRTRRSEDGLNFVSGDHGTCRSAMEAIYAIDPDNPEFIETLLEMLEEGDERLFDVAAITLAKIAVSGISIDKQRAAEVVKLRFDEWDSDSGSGGFDMGWTREKLYKRHLAYLCFDPADQDVFRRISTYDSVDFLSDNEFLAVRALRQADAWESVEARQKTLESIQSLISVKQNVWGSARHPFYPSDAPKSYTAVDMMTMLDPEGRESGPLLIDLFHAPYHNDVDLCDKIAEAITTLPNGRELLHEQACDESEPVPYRTPAIRVLGRWSEEHVVLVELLSHDSARIRLAALQGLERIAADAAFAREDVEQLLDDDLITIRRAAQNLLDEINAAEHR